MKPYPTRRTRRAFFRAAGAALAAPYAVSSTALGAPARPAPSDRITTALIGSGGRGQQIIAGGDRVVAVCDVDAKHAEATRAKIDQASGTRGCAVYSDFREVLARDDLDAVVVATPDHWHVPIAKAAIEAGKAVYVEKPLSLSIHEGRILVDAVERYNAVLQVGSQQRSDEKFIKACELVRNGRIGDLKRVKVAIYARSGNDNPWRPQRVPPELDYEMWLGQAPYSPYHKDRVHYKFRFVTDFSGGDMTNWGAHHLDIAQWALAADESGPVEIEGAGKRNLRGIHDTFYEIAVDLKYACGVTVELRSSDDAQQVKTGGLRFEGTEGWIEVSRERLDAEPASLLTSRIGPDEIRLAPESEAGTHMGIWLDCIRKRNPKGVNVSAETGHRSATVCHLANTAMELERKLTWDPAEERFVGDDGANRKTWRPMREPWTV